jgi:nucleoside-diphosphate-sugar epimerase
MKILFIGGSGNISTACSKLAVQKGWEVYHLNRGIKKTEKIDGITSIIADINNFEQVHKLLKDFTFDVVANFIAFTQADIERDFKLFQQKTKQYIFISSASVYEKPLTFPYVTESTPLKNPFWEYSRNKITAEEKLNQLYREHDFPITIIRPSLTYQFVIPMAIGSWDDYTIVDRIHKGKPIIVHGDGTSLWTITHAEDFAKGFVGLLNHQQAIGHAFHITSDEILTWNQIYQAVADAVNCKANIVHIASDYICNFADKNGYASMLGGLIGDKSLSVIFDNSKIKSFVPEFNAVIPFRQGIKRTIDWFEAESSRMKIVKTNNEFIDALAHAYLMK